MPFSYPDDVVSADNGLTVDGDIQIDSFSNIARFGPQEALSVLVNATDVFSTPVFLASAAIAGYTLQVNGTGDALIWAAGSGGGGGGEDWAATLALGNNSGANNPHVDTGQFLGFGLEGSTPVSGQIRSSTDFEIRATGGIELISTTTMQMQTIGNIPFKIVTNAVERLEITGAGAWQFQGDAGTSGQFLKSAGSASTPVWGTFALSDLPTIAAKSVLANATNSSAVPAALAGSAAFQHLRVNSANTGLEWAVLTVTAPITLTSDNIGFDQTATLDNNARVGVRKNTAGSTFTRRRLNLIEGTGITLTVADDSGSEEVDVTVTATGTSLSAIADQRVLGNDSGSSAVPVATTIHQTLDWVGGSSPVSWLFDGIDDRVNFGDVRDFQRTDPFTLSGWFQTATGANDSLWVKQAVATPFTGYFVEVETGFIRFFFRGTSIGNEISVRTNAATFADGSRHNVVISYSGSSLASGVSIDVDGVSQAVTVETNTLSTSTLNAGNLYIAFPSAGSFDGLLTDMAIWDVELTPTQRLEVYGSGTPPDLTALATAPDPVKWIKMDSSDATGANGINDYGTDGVDGTAEGSLAPVSGIGSMLARGSTLWQIVPPSAAGFPLASNGVGFVPSYRQLVIGALPSMAAGSFLANVTAGSTVPTAHDLATFAGAGLTYTNVTGILAVGSSTSITVNANDVQRAALTGAVTAAANSNTTAFGVLAAKAVLANATNASAVPAALAGSAAFQHLRVNSANTALEWAVLSSGDFPAGTVPLTGMATQAAETFLGNFTAGVASPTALAGSTVAGAGLTYTTGGILAVGAGTRLTVNANDVQLAAGAAESFLMNATAGSAVADYRAGSSVAGAGLTYTAGGTLAVGAGAGIAANANDVAVDVTANFAWTGTHGFTGSSIIVNSSGTAQVMGVSDITLASTTGGVWVGAGHTPVVSPSVSNGDVVLNGTSGIILHVGATPATGSSGIDLLSDTAINIEADTTLTLEGGTGAIVIASPYRLTAIISPTALSADQNDYTPTGWSTANVVRLITNSAADRTITGALAGQDGEVKYLINATPATPATGRVLLSHENASSAAANRFLFNSLTTFAIDPHDMIGIWYDGTSDRWRVMHALTAT